MQCFVKKGFTGGQRPYSKIQNQINLVIDITTEGTLHCHTVNTTFDLSDLAASPKGPVNSLF